MLYLHPPISCVRDDCSENALEAERVIITLLYHSFAIIRNWNNLAQFNFLRTKCGLGTVLGSGNGKMEEYCCIGPYRMKKHNPPSTSQVQGEAVNTEIKEEALSPV